MGKEKFLSLVLQKAKECGFSAAGFISLSSCQHETDRLVTMIEENRHGEMRYMQENLNARTDPATLLPGAKTIFSAALPYNFPGVQTGKKGKISRYALCPDYHTVMRNKLEEVLDYISRNYEGDVRGKVFVDSSPIFEKAWAEKAGIGRAGKNTVLISPGTGSYLFLGEILLDIELESDVKKVPDLCGNCDICLKSCPTGALLEPGKIDARRCISYLTVELKREFTKEEAAMIGDWLFGCDICQEVCPHNKKKSSTEACPELTPREELLRLTPERILTLTRSQFKMLFAATPIYRTGLKRLKRYAKAVMENLKTS
jgi:epoxyqueuosine reductase